MSASCSGILLVDKPIGCTSFDVIARLRRVLHVKRMGHTGTLDPFASGLLVVCVGQATKIVPFLEHQRKTYLATLRLGQATDTLDCEGICVAEDSPDQLAACGVAQIEAVLPAFRGEIIQRPPAFSAIHIGGERAYAKARRGEAVELPERAVFIEQLEIDAVQLPEVIFRVTCSKGTYIRSLAVDIAQALGYHGHLTALRRLKSGAFSIEDALPLDAICADPSRAAFISMVDALREYPTIQVDPLQAHRLSIGRQDPMPQAPCGVCRVLGPEGQLIAMIEGRGEAPIEILRGFASADADGA